MNVIPILLWGLGICTTGFLFLAGWCWYLIKAISNNSKELEKRISYEWFENKFLPECRSNRHEANKDMESGFNRVDKNMENKFNELDRTIKEIRDALIGTVEKKGLITKIHNQDDRLEKLENKKD